MKPNIIILISDALRPKDLSLYGRKEEYDPCLKRFAAESTTFMNNFSVSNGSDPSVTSLFSGQYPTTSGFIHQHPFMKDEEIEKLKKNKFWLPLYLQKHGYQTMSATPLHMWFKKGFDKYSDKESLKTGKFLDIPIVKRLLLALPSWAYRLGKELVKIRASPEFYPCHKVMDAAIANIKSTRKPFFLFMHVIDTHYPYPIAPIKKIRGTRNMQSIVSGLDSQKQREYVKKRFYDLRAGNMEQIEKKRDDSISAVDLQIRRLHDFLKTNGLWNNTIVFILADHGDNFGEHGAYFCRGGLYDPSIHVPLVAHIPGMKPGIVQGLTQTIDVPATILDVLKEKSYKIDGKSLVPAAKLGKNLRDSVFFADAFCEKRFGIRTGSRKFIVSDDGVCYLCGAKHCKNVKETYDVRNDAEETNIINAQQKELEDKLQGFL